MKMRLLLAFTALAIGFAVPVLAQEKNTIDPAVRQQIEAVNMKYDEAYNKGDAAATGALLTRLALDARTPKLTRSLGLGKDFRPG